VQGTRHKAKGKVAGFRFVIGVAIGVIAGATTLAAGQRAVAGQSPSSSGARVGSPAATAPFRSTATMRPEAPSPRPVQPTGIGLHRWPFFWAWPAWDPADEAPREVVPLPPDAPRGGVQLDVLPWRARVYLDGVYVGRVDDFNGYYQHLEVPAGPHQIVILDSGYQPLVLDLEVPPGRTTTYRATLTTRLR
jgi:hypothetical protein